MADILASGSERLRELALIGAYAEHHRMMTEQAEGYWDGKAKHSRPADACPHPDCILVRTPAPSGTAQPYPERQRCPECDIGWGAHRISCSHSDFKKPSQASTNRVSYLCGHQGVYSEMMPRFCPTCQQCGGVVPLASTVFIQEPCFRSPGRAERHAGELAAPSSRPYDLSRN